MAGERILRSKFALIAGATTELEKNIPGFEIELLNAINDLLGQFETTGGVYVFSENNIQTLNLATSQIREIVNGSAYAQEIGTLFSDFDRITALNQRYFTAAESINIGTINLSALQQANIQKTTESLLGVGINDQFIKPIKDILHDAVVSGEGVRAVQSRLNTFVAGSDERVGALQRHVPQVARDAVNQHDGSIQQQVKESFELNAWSYEGSLIDDSRSQCVRWVNKEIIPDDQLQDEIKWAYKQCGFNNNQTTCNGMIPGTTPENWPVFRGGFNCRHHATPTRI